MKQLLKLITLSIISFYIFSCSGGGGGAPVLTPEKPSLPDARTIPSVKSLKVESDHVMCASNFSSELSDKQMSVKTAFNDDKTFNVVITFYDSPCIGSTASGNKIATYNFSGVYAVTDLEGRTVMTITDSKMTILAGDYPAATKKFVDWMNSCDDLEGSFSHTENTTLSLALGPKCNSNVARAYPFMAIGGSQESTEADLNRLVSANQK